MKSTTRSHNVFWIVVALAIVAPSCGRTGVETDLVDHISPPDSASGGAVPNGRSGAGGAPVAGAPNGGGTNSTGGLAGLGSAGIGGAGNGGSGVSGSTGSAGSSEAGRPSIVDDPLTLGDDRPGWTECYSRADAYAHCGPGTACCTTSPGCLTPAQAGTCSQALYRCDGDEDCVSGEHCCRETGACAQTCSQAGILTHIKCIGPCRDFDYDGIPDGNDQCIFTPEDGKGPYPLDGCPDSDGDGVPDDRDQCATMAEDGLPPNPQDGCPKK